MLNDPCVESLARKRQSSFTRICASRDSGLIHDKMAVVEESSSFQNDLTDRGESASCSSSSIVQETRNLSLNDMVENGKQTDAGKLSAAFAAVKNEQEDEDDEDFDESNHNFLYNQLLNPSKTNQPPQFMRDTLDRKASSRSLQDPSGRSLDGDDDKSWNTLSSVHSRTELEDEKSWQKLDSVHSRSSVARSGCDLDGSSSSNESFTSFASFDSEAEEAELLVQRAAFQSLAEEPTPRTVFMRSQSQRGNMMRHGTGLSLIDEKSSLD